MPNRLVQFSAALVASLIASVPLVAGSRGETPTGDQCLASPKAETPGGGHWRYRVEHPSNRHCWYLRTDNATAAQSAKPSPPVAAEPAEPDTPTSASMSGSVANAHAELTSRRAGAQNTRAATSSFPAPLPPTVPAVGNSAPANNADVLRAAVAARWPDQQAANAPTPAAANATDDDAAADATPQAAAPQSPPANVSLAVADAAPIRAQVSPQTLIFALIGAVSAAALVAGVVGFGGRRRTRVRLAKAQADRRANWDAAGPARQRRPPLSVSIPTELPSPRRAPAPSPPIAPVARQPSTRIPRELWQADEHDEHDDNVAEMLARLARSAQV